MLCLLLLFLVFVSAAGHAYRVLSRQEHNKLSELLSEHHYLSATVMVLSVMTAVAIVVLGHELIVPITALRIALLVLTLLVFGDIIPRAIACASPERFARFAAVPMTWLVAVLKPVTFLLVRGDGGVNDNSPRRKVEISMDELSNAIDMTEQSAEERRMLSEIVEFVNTEVGEIMKPRVDIVALDDDDSFEKVKEVIISSGFSRIPVYEETLDHVTGVLYIKDMLPHLTKDDFSWRGLVRKPYFVPAHKKINDLLEEFRADQIHVAIVVDEYGSTVGLVSLEDILEEVVGEITDESDVEHEFYKKLSHNVYLFDGKTHLSEVVKVLELDDEYFDDCRGEAETIAGLMLEIRKDFLSQGDIVYCRDFTISAENVEGRRVDKVRAVYKPAG